MPWTPGDVSGSEILTDADHIHENHINELRTSVPSSVVVGRSANSQYYCDGVADDVQINAAIAAVVAAGGGRVILKQGTYSIASSINVNNSNVELVGFGDATKLMLAASANTRLLSLVGAGVVNVHVKNMTLDGNKSNNTTGAGIHINTPWNGTDSHHVFEDLMIQNFDNNGVEVAQTTGSEPHPHGDTRIMHFNRVHVKLCDGNGFYFPVFSASDSFFNECIVEQVALNGFYLGINTSYFNNCYTFWCGSAGGNYHGFYIVAYNNTFNQCIAQDNYQSGFFGDNTQGYNANGCTFTGCLADTNGQNANAAYSTGFQGIDVYNWRITGGYAITRVFPPAWTQKYGVRFSGGSSANYVDPDFLMYGNSVADFLDTSDPGVNSYRREFNVRDFGALGNGKQVAGVTCTSASASVTVPSGAFTAADIGKTVLIFDDFTPGTLRTISAVTDATHITLSGTAGVTLTTAGYIAYGHNDATAFANCIAAAEAFATVNGTPPNQAIGLGMPKVVVPALSGQSLYFLTSQVTVPSGLQFQADGMIFNALANRYQAPLVFEPYTEIIRLTMDCGYGNGIVCGTVGQAAQVKIRSLTLWQVGKATSGGFFQDGLVLQGYDHELGSIFIKGGYRGIYCNSGSDLTCASLFAIGCNTAVELNATHQWHFANVFMDTCGGTGNGGFLIDGGCFDGYAKIQTYLASGVTKVVSPVVGIGQQDTATQNRHVKIDIIANNSGGTILAVQRMTDLEADITASNAVGAGTGSIATAVVYGSNNAGYLKIRATLDTGITPYTGTRYAGFDYYQGGIHYPGHPSAGVKTGLAKISGGATQYGVPGTVFVSASTSVLTINQVRYVPFQVKHPITITAHQFEVTAGPASDANVRVGIYLADSDLQPTGAPVYDSGSIAVATAFTGVKTTSSLTTVLGPGTYLLAINTNVAMTLRSLTAGSHTIQANIGASPMVQLHTVAQAYGAFPNPGTAWTAVTGTAGGYHFGAVFQWTE